VSVGLYLDVHLPAAITRGLLLRGVDVLTAQIDGTAELDDPDLGIVSVSLKRGKRFFFSSGEKPG